MSLTLSLSSSFFFVGFCCLLVQRLPLRQKAVPQGYGLPDLLLVMKAGSAQTFLACVSAVALWMELSRCALAMPRHHLDPSLLQ